MLPPSSRSTDVYFTYDRLCRQLTWKFHEEDARKYNSFWINCSNEQEIKLSTSFGTLSCSYLPTGLIGITIKNTNA